DLRRITGCTGTVQDVSGGLESRPQRVVGLPAGPARTLPLLEQVAIRSDAVLALRGQRLRLLDERGLAIARRLVRLVHLGIELAAPAVQARACIAEALPELLGRGLRQPRPVLLLALPLLEQLGDLCGGLLPLDRLRVPRRQLLDPLHQLGAPDHGLLDRFA